MPIDSSVSATPPLRSTGFPSEIPYIEQLGILLTELSDGVAVATLDLERRHMNSFEVAHGGTLMSLLDVSMAMAVRGMARAGGGDTRSIATIEMKTSFMRPAVGRLRARALVVHRTRSMAFCEAEIRSAQDEIIARASGTFSYKLQEAT
jgi:uncharacterized protein (TIGR00369 family)